MVEYALMVAAFVVVVAIGLQVVQNGAEQELATKKSDIADPGVSGAIAATTSTVSTIPGPVSSTTTTSSPSSTTSSTSSTTTTLSYSGTVVRTCGGNSCSFSMSPAPPTTPAWSISPGIGAPSGASGTLPGPISFSKAGTFTVTGRVGSVDFTTTVVCVKNASVVTCS
jgi:hypothetical protein